MGLLAFLLMLGFDLLFLAVLILVMIPLGIYRQAASAVLKRNFIGYFINPIGYVFLSLFLVFAAGFAFWPDGFFAANLANFDQLNQYLPLIMLVIIPAITMSSWSEEKRQGTDELLLTLPTSDIDIVIGKYFAAILIFTVALLLSQLWNVFILILLTQGDLDVGLLFTTYLGYWFIGLAMLSIGMVASFLTHNLTVGFLIGALFNVPLALLTSVDTIVSQANWASVLSQWGLRARFDPFGRGLLSLPSIIYFLGIAAIGIYLCRILIGRRHWAGSSDSWKMSLHYLVRSLVLVVALVSLTLATENTALNRIRIDASEGRLSSLAPETRQILTQLAQETTDSGDNAAPIQIEAFIAPEVPSEYAQTRYDLLTALREFDALGGSRLQVKIHSNVEPFSEEASLAEKRYGIDAVEIRTRSRGTWKTEEVIMGAVFTCNLQRVVVPFFEYGIPVEYELIRSINTVAQARRKVLGVVQTDARFMGGTVGNVLQQTSIPKEQIIVELEKQYDVEPVDPSQPIATWIDDPENPGTKRLRYDALLVIQPSSLGPVALDHVANAIQAGIPSAVFEDPLPVLKPYVPGTNVPKQADPTLAMLGQARSEPKGNMSAIWDLLHIETARRVNTFGQEEPYIIWQVYNPYPEIDDFNNTPEFVFVRNVMSNVRPEESEDGTPWTGFPVDPLNTNATQPTENLEELLLPYPGAIRRKEGEANTDFYPLVRTGFAGRVGFEALTTQTEMNQDMVVTRGSEDGYYTLAARVMTPAEDAKKMRDELANSTEEDPTKLQGPIDVIYVSDLDCLISGLVNVRSRPQQSDADMGGSAFRWQNLVFLLNVVDSLTGETKYINIRSRTQSHRTLKTMEAKSDEERRQSREIARDTAAALKTALLQEQEKLEEAIQQFRTQVTSMERKKQRGEEIDELELAAKRDLLKQEEANIQKRLETRQTLLERKSEESKRQARRTTDLEIQKTQSFYKTLSVAVPPVPLLIIGIGVFAYRRLREREGISKNRLK